MSAIGEKRDCPTCHQFVEVMELIANGDGWYTQKLSGGHSGRIKIMDPIVENISIRDRVESQVKRFRTIGDTPILVTDSSGTQLISGSVQITTFENKVTGGNIYYNSTIHYDVKVDSNTTINNIQNILSMVDSNNTYTLEEKRNISNLPKLFDIAAS